MNDHLDGPSAGSRVLDATSDALEIDVDFEGSENLHVQEISIDDELSSLPLCTVVLSGRGVTPNPRELLRRDCEVRIGRGPQVRFFRGIIWHARIEEKTEHFELYVHVVPAAQLLTQIVDSYIYQNASVPEVVAAAFERVLGSLGRRVDIQLLDREYPKREYVVQYQETVYDFIMRLCEDDGVFVLFDHDRDGERHEVLILADSASGLPRAVPRYGGAIAYSDSPSMSGSETDYATRFSHVERVGATAVAVRGYDWTRPPALIEEKVESRDRARVPKLEIYDPSESVELYDYGSDQYNESDARAKSQIRAQLLDVLCQSWSLETNLLTAQSGCVVRVQRAHGELPDGEYLVISASSTGMSGSGDGMVWRAALRVVPTSMPYRPPRRTPRPVVHGPETAFVVGPAKEDIHTDVHGRVKVQFHWDRQHRRNDESSWWLRVAHNWAGAAFGAFFLPRVGMEVVVSFLGGNPDRPLVTGCVYNGDNHVPHLTLPQEKTQTVIRTRSSGPSGPGTGYNELRFEDLTDAEFISVHAQRDLREKVLRNRTTQIHNDDRLTVTRNSYIKIRGTEEHWVTKNARWSYPSQVEYDLNRRRTSVGFASQGEGPGDYYLNGAERVTAFGNSASDAAWKDISDSDGRFTEFTATSSWGMTFEDGTFHLKATNDPPTQLKFDAAAGTVDTGASARVMMVAGASGVKIEPDKVGILSPGQIKIETQSGAASIEVSDSAITLKIGAAEMTLTPAGVITNAPVFIVTSGFVSRGGPKLWD